MNIIFVASECYPFAEASSLAELIFKLSKEVEGLGHNVKLFIPRYGFIEPGISYIERIPQDFKVYINGTTILTSVYKGILPGSFVNVFFIC